MPFKIKWAKEHLILKNYPGYRMKII